MKKKRMQFELPVSILREGKDFIAYSPALDLSSAGSTPEQAQSNLEQAAELFFEGITEMGTFEEVLAELGWKKENNRLSPPVVVSQNIRRFSVQGPAAAYA